uniref:Uncharacterized protein n=1 Tax=viral metagenome TaxID=1070528 RepID=A0A6C0EWD8_9ZZZZ
MFEMLVDNTVKEKNKKEWQRINNIWLEVKNNNKSRNPELYDTESDDSCDYESTNKPQKELKRADSSYDELLHAHDCIITEKNEIECTTPNIYDGIEDSKTHFTSSSSDGSNDNDNETENAYRITMYEIKNKYKIENSYMLEIDYSMNYNMKMLTHIANYYNIIKNNKNGLGIVAVAGTKTPKIPKIPKTKKLLKPELIKEIISFETDESNHQIVLKFRKMLEKIDELKQDRYFSSFILFS